MSLRRFTVVALDLDGTTLTSDHILSESTIQILRRLSAKNVLIVIATGRSAPSVYHYLDILQLPQKVNYVVCYNGSCGFRNELGREPQAVFTRALPLETTMALLNISFELGLVAQYYNGATGEVQAIPKSDEHIELLSRYAELVGKKQTILSSYEEAIAKSLSAKLLILTKDPDGLIDVCRQRLPPDSVTMFRGSPNPFFVEFLPPGVTKGDGLKEMCKHLGISVDNVVAFGDGENDAEFLKYAGLGVAMKNSKPLAKNAADVILEYTNDEDGVAKYLQYMESQNMF